MGISCDSCDASSTTVEVLQRLMFGPAYDQVKSGQVTLSSSYSSIRSLTPVYLDQCCSYLSPGIVVNDWGSMAVLTSGWFAFTFSLYIALFSIRDSQLVKIRDIRMITVFVLSMMALVSFLNFSYMMGGTAERISETAGTFICFVLYLYFHLARSIRLLFIYKWHEAKARGAGGLRWFIRFRFVVGAHFAVAASLIVLIVFVVPLMAYLMWDSPVFSTPGTSLYSTIRCDWWHIPDAYTHATSNSSMCGCIRASFLKEGDAETLCTSGFLNTCMTSKSSLESALCDACSSTFSSGTITAACEAEFLNMYTSGACGFPRATPNFEACRVGIFADPNIGNAFAGVSYLLLFLNFLAIIPVGLKRDYFGIILENTLMLVTVVPSFTLVWLSFLYPKTVDWWTYDLPLYVTVGNIALWTGSAISVGFPVLLYYLQKKSPRLFKLLNTNLTDLSEANPLPKSDASTSEASGLTQDVIIHSTSNAYEKALHQCIASKALKEIYTRFTIEEFTTENVQFLDRCMQLFQTLDESFDPETFSDLTQDIYDKFIAENADMQVNLAAKQRREIYAHLQALRLSSDINWEPVINSKPPPGGVCSSSHPSPLMFSTEDELLSAISMAFAEIVRLMAKSSWPRFVMSRHYPEFLRVREIEEHKKRVEMHISLWIDDPNPGNIRLHNRGLAVSVTRRSSKSLSRRSLDLDLQFARGQSPERSPSPTRMRTHSLPGDVLSLGNESTTPSTNSDVESQTPNTPPQIVIPLHIASPRHSRRGTQ